MTWICRYTRVPVVVGHGATTDSYRTLPLPLLPPTRRPGQLCRTTDVGVVLEALGTTQYCHRVAVEKDFYCLPTAPQAIDILNRDGQVRGTLLIWWRRPLPSSTLCHPST